MRMVLLLLIQLFEEKDWDILYYIDGFIFKK